MAKSPILPSNPADPTGMDRLERSAMRDFKARIKRCVKAFADAVDKIPNRPVVNASYTYDLDAFTLSSILAGASTVVDDVLLEGGAAGVWFFTEYVDVAATRGISQQFANLSGQSATYAADRVSVAEILRSTPHRRRMALVAAREFELMQGLSGEVKADLSRVLTDGVGRGLSPREVAKNITARTDINARRANRIARTEITTALRRARWDEAEDASQRLGLDIKLMHFSALSTTTRLSHANRHGNLYTQDETRDWYAEGANSINCKCSQIEVMMGDDGKPLVPQIIDRARDTMTRFKKENRGPWAEG